MESGAAAAVVTGEGGAEESGPAAVVTGTEKAGPVGVVTGAEKSGSVAAVTRATRGGTEKSGPVAVVTGAANGIGRAVALRLRDDGFLVAGADIETVGPADGIMPCVLDVADLGEHERVLDRVEAGLGPLFALVNVAGMFVPEKLEDLTLEAWRRQHAVMLEGPAWLARSAGLRMAARGSGRIVNVTSVHASNGETASLAYDSAKAGLEAVTRNLAIELGPRGVLVNSVAPGFVRSRMSIVDGVDEVGSEWFRQIYLDNGRLPLRRAAEPAEIAAAVSHLVSPDNTYLTGQRIVVDGGLLVTF
jgi:NAD(P)-dependent dehydrogenase (short-subunit alcohol dehydrogenase family)